MREAPVGIGILALSLKSSAIILICPDLAITVMVKAFVLKLVEVESIRIANGVGYCIYPVRSVFVIDLRLMDSGTYGAIGV
jgi:hypothetical protein